MACEILRAELHGPEPLGPCTKCGTEATVWYPAGKEFRLRVSGILGRSVPKGGGRWQYQSQCGHSVFAQDGSIHWVEREIDRISNEYHERIIDKATGQVVREVHEPLSEHRGRGCAKRVRKSRDGAA